jgi:RNA polymerase primary sigma factor
MQSNHQPPWSAHGFLKGAKMINAAPNQSKIDHRQLEMLKKRTAEILRDEINFIMNPSFATIDNELEQEILEGTQQEDAISTAVPKNLPGHLARLCEANILTAEQERGLFREMNYLKCRANVYRTTLDPEKPDPQTLRRVELFLRGAERVRNRLIKANMRLAISVVKKFVTSRHSFDDLLSDGIFSLMQAVDKFDYDRGFRFSTYAYRAIARNAYRLITKDRKEVVRFSSDATESSVETMIDQSSPTADDQRWLRLRDTLGKLISRLDRREQLIVRSRYALGAHRKVKTFQAIAERLGVSKERVRQLEQRAMGKLRTMASELDLDDAIEPLLSRGFGSAR